MQVIENVVSFRTALSSASMNARESICGPIAIWRAEAVGLAAVSEDDRIAVVAQVLTCSALVWFSESST